MEIANYASLFNDKLFCAQFYHKKRKNDPINTVYESWYGRNELLLTRIIRSSILDIEAAMCSCVHFEAAFRNILTENIKQAISNPFSLGGRSTATNFYDKLPALIDPNLSLSISNNKLWVETKLFYKNVRNPLFHGKELAENSPSIVKECLDLIIELFKWLESWFDISRIVKNAGNFNKIPELGRFVHQIVSSEVVPKDEPFVADDFIDTPGISNVLGMMIAEYVQFTVETSDQKQMNIKLSPKAAMKMLAFLAVTHKHTGWPIPERI
jgi:hypothetical protein